MRSIERIHAVKGLERKVCAGQATWRGGFASQLTGVCELLRGVR